MTATQTLCLPASPSSAPAFLPAGYLIRFTCRRIWPHQLAQPPHKIERWAMIRHGWDIERPAILLDGKVWDGTRRLFAAWRNQPTMLVPVVSVRTRAELQLRILPLAQACRTYERQEGRR